MNWREIVEPAFVGWPAAEKQRALETIAIENDHAERLGFQCHLDDRRGYGYCFFTKHAVRVWNGPDGWCRAPRDDQGRYAARSVYHTLSQALTEDHQFGSSDEYGNVVSNKAVRMGKATQSS